jgi:hypothetical protein
VESARSLGSAGPRGKPEKFAQRVTKTHALQALRRPGATKVFSGVSVRIART